MNFSQLGLAPAQVRSCESLGYTEPTPIQLQAIPVVLSGQDLIGCAETGTGKTAAFLLPIIQKITSSATSPRPKGSQKRKVRVLVLAPTRELAAQIEKNYNELNRVKANRSVNIIGGASCRDNAMLFVVAWQWSSQPRDVCSIWYERGALNLSLNRGARPRRS